MKKMLLALAVSGVALTGCSNQEAQNTQESIPEPGTCVLAPIGLTINEGCNRLTGMRNIDLLPRSDESFSPQKQATTPLNAVGQSSFGSSRKIFENFPDFYF